METENQEPELASIKKPGEIEYISKEEYQRRVEIIKKCKRDICYFAENFFKIINLDTGITTIKLYPKQRELLKFLCNEDRGVVLSARQSSKTTTYTIFSLWYTMFFNDKKIMILCNKASVMIEVISRIQLAYEYLPKFLKSSVQVWNKGEIVFSNHSVIKGFPASSDSGRSFSANCVFWDEAAFTQNNLADKIFTSIYPTISTSSSSKFFMISTPNGVDPKQVYYDTYMKAKRKDNKEGWKLFEFYWFDVPMRDQAWREKTIASIGEKRFAQEFNNEFLTQDALKKLIPDDIIDKYRQDISKNKENVIYKGKDIPIYSKDSNKTYTFKMYKSFSPNRTYIGSSDCAEGIGKDSSVLYIWDITDTSNIEMVAKFSDNQVSILEFAFITHEILKLYGKPFIACECNGISLGYIEQLRVTYEYENFVRLNRDNGCGIQSHVQVKTKACLWFRDMMTTMGFGFTLRDMALIEEMGTFIKKDTKVHDVYAAVGDNHDDHIMTMIWMCWILNQENIDKYFVVTDYFTSSLGNQYPRNIQSLFEYSPQEIEEIRNMEQNKTFFDHVQNNIEAYREEELRMQGQNTETMKMLGAQTLVNDQMAWQQEMNKTVVYSQEEMMRGFRRNPQSSFQRDNDRSLIFGTGDKIYGIGGTQGGGWSVGGFTWEDEGRMW